jgi:hypothetical protein
MSASKATIPLVATMMVLLMGVILYPQGSANARTHAMAASTGEVNQCRWRAIFTSTAVGREIRFKNYPPR